MQEIKYTVKVQPRGEEPIDDHKREIIHMALIREITHLAETKGMGITFEVEIEEAIRG